MLTEQECEIIEWCLRTEASRCDKFLEAEAFDAKTFRTDYYKRKSVTMAALRKIEETHRLTEKQSA